MTLLSALHHIAPYYQTNTKRFIAGTNNRSQFREQAFPCPQPQLKAQHMLSTHQPGRSSEYRLVTDLNRQAVCHLFLMYRIAISRVPRQRVNYPTPYQSVWIGGASYWLRDYGNSPKRCLPRYPVSKRLPSSHPKRFQHVNKNANVGWIGGEGEPTSQQRPKSTSP